MDDAAIRRLRKRGGEQPALPLSAVARHHRAFGGLRLADADGDGLRRSFGGGRSGARGRGHLLAGRYGAAVRRDPARRGHHVDDDQFDGGDFAELLLDRRAPPGRGRPQALGHDSKRHPKGIHRARHLYLSAAAGDAHHHRPVRLGGRGDAGVEHDLDQRVSHSRSGIDGGAGGCVHAGQRDRLYRSGRSRRTRCGCVRAAAVVFLQRA